MQRLKRLRPVWILLAAWLTAFPSSAADAYSPDDSALEAVDRQPVLVFILAGQSNMEGQGVVDLDHPQYYNGGKGTLNRVLKDPAFARRFPHLRDDQGKWVVRDDVWVRFRTGQGVKAGGLSIGFSGYPGKHHIGPEFQFGHVLGQQLKQPVLLIKTAWGGKSLFKDFRPPSAGGDVGPFYTKMLKEIHEALENRDREFPALRGRENKLAGFVWFQGWNDMFDSQGRNQYEANLVHLIHDVRQTLKSPQLPVVVGELGNGGPKANANMMAIREAQAQAAGRAEFAGTVGFVKTSSFARPKDDSPNVGHGHHWFGNAESYFLIGDAMGKRMLELVTHHSPQRGS